MKLMRIVALISVSLSALSANAEMKSLEQIMDKATAQGSSNLGELLKQIQLEPTKDPKTGETVFKVLSVEKGSIYEREGVRAGDLLSSGSASKSGMRMELSHTKRTKRNADSAKQ